MTQGGNKIIDLDYLNFLQGVEPSKQMSLLLYGEENSGKTTILADFVYRGVVDEKQNAIFVTFAEKPISILQKLRAFGWDFDALVEQKKILFLDASPVANCEEIGACDTMSPLVERLKYAIGRNGAKRVVIDGLSDIFRKISNKKLVREAVFKIIEYLREAGISYIIASKKSSLLLEADLEKYLADATVLIEAKQKGKRICRTFKVSRVKNKQVASAEDNFEVGSRGLKVCSTNSQQILV